VENPATWGRPEKVIDKAWDEWCQSIEDEVCGPSLPWMIADALRKEGLLREIPRRKPKSRKTPPGTQPRHSLKAVAAILGQSQTPRPRPPAAVEAVLPDDTWKGLDEILRDLRISDRKNRRKRNARNLRGR
jgi:hypothetical protein